jgi:hypothetical protein
MHYVCTEKNTFELFFFNKHIFGGFTNKTKRHVYLFYTFFLIHSEQIIVFISKGFDI